MITDSTIWNEAREIWLASLPENTMRTYEVSLRMLLDYCKRQPWEISKREITQWVSHLKKSCSDSTITSRLSAISAFYRFINIEYAIPNSLGHSVTLRDDNPTTGIARPKVSQYGKSYALDKTQAKALLGAINRKTVIGLRDYALFLMYLMTGRRNTELRLLRYEDIEVHPDKTVFRWSGKGRVGVEQEINPPVMEAIQAYSAAENRYHGYIFHSYTTKGEIMDAPMSPGYVRRACKYYGRKAGLNPAFLKVHTLRHTAAVLRNEAGDDPEVIREYLGHTSLATTQIYLQKLKTRQDGSWQTVAEWLGLPESDK